MVAMKEEAIQEELKTLAEKLGVMVSYERFFGVGGLCKVGKDRKIIVNKDLSIEKKNEILITELSGFDLENVYVTPVLRQLLGAPEPEAKPEAVVETGDNPDPKTE